MKAVVPVVLRVVVVLAAGVVLYASFPPRDLWWLAPLSFAGWASVLHGRRARAGFGYGFLFGLAFLLPLLAWVYAFLGTGFGPWPWLGLVALESLFFAAAGAASSFVSRLPGFAVWTALILVCAELARSRVPFGGFPWAKIAFSQPTGVFLPLASVGGAVLVGFAVAVTGTGLGLLVIRWSEVGFAKVAAWRGPALAVVLPAVCGVAVMPLIRSDANAGVARVAVVQGNAPDIGLGLLGESDALYANHLRGAEQLAADVRDNRVLRPDLVILPESTSSWGPERYDPGLAGVARELGVPVAAGGTAVSREGVLSNRIVRWDPRRGSTDEYVKQQLVPFGEYMPLRELAAYVTPFADSRDMAPGRGPGVFPMGPARVGLANCYEVAYDYVLRDATRSGATLLAVPSNNAWYGRTEMTYQQLAMAQVRAVENGRSVLVAANSGVSAIVRPDGRVTQQTGQFTAETLVSQVPLRSTLTLATRLGEAPDWLVAIASVVGLGWAGWRRLARRRRNRTARYPPLNCR
ncbi:apolipoprotein N-acyltransferase [Saccharopolyspora tripterygii]